MSSFADSDSETSSQEEQSRLNDESLVPYKTSLGAPRYNIKFIGNLIGHREDLYNILQDDFQLTLPNKKDFLEKLLNCIDKTRQVKQEYQLENACAAVDCICDNNTSVGLFKSLAQKLDYFSKQEDYKEVEDNVLASLSLTMNDVHVQTYFQGNKDGVGTLTIYIVDEHTSSTIEYIDEIKDVMDELGFYPKEYDEVMNFNNFIFLNLIAAEEECEQFLGYEALKKRFFIS
jgi:hypothetical protein